MPYTLADEFEPLIQLGNLYLLKNFTVKMYTNEDKFRCLRSNYQIVFNEETELIHLEENVVKVENCCFDFYEIAELENLSKQNTYLTGTEKLNLSTLCSETNFLVVISFRIFIPHTWFLNIV